MTLHATNPVWQQEGGLGFEPLSEDLQVDVCVIGAGIAGLTTAYMLAREGRSVAVLDRGPIAGGETSRTTAHLSNALDEGYVQIEKLFGESGSRLARESHSAAIDCIESICRAEGIDCDFARVDGYLFHPSGASSDTLDREFIAARHAGLLTEYVERAPLPTFDTGSCLRFPGQAQFDPLRYVNGLARAIGNKGGRIHTGSPVVRVVSDEKPYVETENGNIVSAGAIVVATNTPINDNLTIHSRQSPLRTYVIGARIAWDAVPRALYWDTADPYHYVRLKSSSTPGGREGYDILIAGGEDHKQGEAEHGEARFRYLEQWTRERFPIGQVDYRWSGMVMEPADSLALIGRDSSAGNVYVATGDSGHGITHGTLAGMILSDLICDRQSPWAPLYDPSRITARAALNYLGDYAGVIQGLGKWVTDGDVTSEGGVTHRSGAIIRKGLRKLAIRRDELGQLHGCSAVCPHLGCIVAWNSTERSWDCPCHGSRFDETGKVVTGPATSDLAPLSD